jgi:hypothetical protein
VIEGYIKSKRPSYDQLWPFDKRIGGGGYLLMINHQTETRISIINTNEQRKQQLNFMEPCVTHRVDQDCRSGRGFVSVEAPEAYTDRVILASLKAHGRVDHH